MKFSFVLTAVTLATCLVGPLHVPVARAQSLTIVSLDPELPGQRAQLELERRGQLASYRLQSVGAGFTTVLGILFTFAALPGAVVTWLLASYGSSDDATKFGIATAATLVAGISLLVGGGLWWSDSRRAARELSVQPGDASLQPWMGPHGAGLSAHLALE